MPASRRVSASERFRAQVDELFASGRELGQILEEVARAGVALLFQVALEAEVTEFLGRDRYARGDRAHEGLRNGYAPITVKSTSGPITLERPKLRENPEPFTSRLLGIGVSRTKALESLVIASFVRGLSDRDVEAALEEALGEQAALSKSTVSRICQVLVSQYEVWQKRGLKEYELDYLFCDASFFKYHPTAKGEPILCTHGITTEGKRVFISLSAGAAESYDSWHAHFTDLRERGLKTPLPGISDGAPGLVGAFEQVYSESLRQKCVVHGCRNVLEKVSKPDQEAVKQDYWAIFNQIDAPPGEEAVSVAHERARKFADKYGGAYPRAVDCLLTNLSALTAHLQFPVEHRERIRHTNLLERTFGESRRRVKVIGRLPGENTCLSLVWAVLDRASVGWRGIDTSVARHPALAGSPPPAAATPGATRHRLSASLQARHDAAPGRHGRASGQVLGTLAGPVADVPRLLSASLSRPDRLQPPYGAIDAPRHPSHCSGSPIMGTTGGPPSCFYTARRTPPVVCSAIYADV
jgi:putative transposase